MLIGIPNINMMYEIPWDKAELPYIRANIPFIVYRLVLQFLRKVHLIVFRVGPRV